MYRIFFIVTLVVLSLTSGFDNMTAVAAVDTNVADMEQIDFANGLFQRGLYGMAVVEYEKFISSHPQSEHLHEAYFGAGESSFFLKSYHKAIEQYGKYLEQFFDGEKASLCTLRTGQAFFFIKEYRKALLNFLAIEPEMLDNKFQQILYFYTAKCYRAQGAHNDALEYFQKSTERITDNSYAVYAFLEMGEVYAKNGEYAKAVENYAQAHDNSQEKTIKGLTIYKSGEAQFFAGNYQDAIMKFRQILMEYPDETVADDAVVNLFLSLFNVGEYDELITEYADRQMRLRIDHKFLEAHLVMVSARIQLEQYTQALEVLDWILDFDHLTSLDREKILVQKVQLLVTLRQFQYAVDLVDDQLLEASTQRDRIGVLKAESQYGLGQFAQSYALYCEILKEFPETEFVDDILYAKAHAQNSLTNFKQAKIHFLEYFEKGKDDAKRQEALYNAVLIAKKFKEYEEVIRHAKTYLSEFPDGGHKEKILFQLGSAYSKISSYTKGITILKQFIEQFKKSPKRQKAYFLLAYNLQMTGEVEEAVQYYDRIHKNKDEKSLFYAALKNRALLDLKNDRKEVAIKLFHQIIMEFDKNDLEIETYLWLAEEYLRQKRFEDVLKVLDKGGMKNVDAQQRGGIVYFLAIAHKELGHFEDAVIYFEKSLKDSPKGGYAAAARMGKGICLKELNKLDEAKEAFEEAIQINLDDTTMTMRARFEVANIARLKGDLEEAAKFYMLVAVLYNDGDYCSRALFQAGMLFEKLEHVNQAKKVYQEIMDLYQSNPIAIKAKERIEVLHGQ